MAAVNALESLNVGDMFLTKYQMRGLIGRGGQATVYHGYDTFIDRDVAIKIMTDAFDSNREHSRRAQMEARVLCRLQHPNIVHVYDAGSTDSGAIYIIMELLKGRTLREVLRDVRQLTVYEALSLGAQIADGVDVAHRQQVIHRDLKPENIIVVDGNVIKVLDFGIAKFLTLTGMTTQRDTLRGTMWYISPEHVQGLGVTARSDIYALGSILYEAMCGTPPCLVGLQEISTPSVAWSQISRVPPQLDELVPEVPPHVGRLIQRMLVKEPRERPASMAEVAAALRSACARLNEEVNCPVTALRDLWRDTQVRAVSPGKTLVGPGFENTPGNSSPPNAMQPTIEVREPTSRDSVSSDPGIDAGPAVESKPLMLNRRVLLMLALVIGTLLGLGLGLSGGLSSKQGKAQKSISAQATPLVEVARQPPPVVSNSPVAPSISATNVQPAAATSAMPAQASTSALGDNDRVSTTRPSVGSPPAVRAPRKKTPGTTPQPRYSGADLE
jgi:serine/threonine protein kinase